MMIEFPDVVTCESLFHQAEHDTLYEINSIDKAQMAAYSVAATQLFRPQ